MRLGGENAVVETKIYHEDNIFIKKSLTYLCQSGSQVKCVLRALQSIRSRSS